MSCILRFSPISAPASPLARSNGCSLYSQFPLSASKNLVLTSIQKPHAPISPTCSNCTNVVSSVEPTQESLSAKERRKQRNERREQLKAGKVSWKEEVENKLLEKKKPPKGWKYEMDVNRLAAKGLQWWMVFVPSRSEVEMAETLTKAYSEHLPNNEFQVFVPIVPSKRRLKDGSYSSSKSTLHPGCVFLRTVMDRQVYDVVRRVRGFRGFFGSKVGYLVQIVMPTPVPADEMEGILSKIREEEEDLERLKDQLRKDKKAMHAMEDGVEENSLLNVGSSIRVVSGPYANFEGHITDLLHEEGKVKALLMTFGKEMVAELSLDQVEAFSK